jgi:hypothetical protein
MDSHDHHHASCLMLRSAARRRTKPFTCARVVIDEEKGSDVNLGAHLVHDALTGACTKAIVVTNDSDLALPIRMAVQAGVPVGLVNPHDPRPMSGHLKKEASFRIPFRREVVAKCQMPMTVKTSKGKEVHCPQDWR